jgi:signal transduction histidine kinase
MRRGPDQVQLQTGLSAASGFEHPAVYYTYKTAAELVLFNCSEAVAASREARRELLGMAWDAELDTWTALALAAHHDQATPGEQEEHRAALASYQEQLRVWQTRCPQTFLNRYALLSAEIARIEGRDLDAMRHYQEAVRSARENGFVHNEALAYEMGSRFYRARGFDEIADAYLRGARASYLRWGAEGKVKQIDRQHPHLVEPSALPPTATLAVRAEQLDLYSVTKASQTISGEIVLDKLTRTLIEVVLEQGGAQRACLILCRDMGLSIEAEATLDPRGATTLLGSEPVDGSPRVPVSLVQYVLRTKERVILFTPATQAGKFSGDEYFARVRPKSVLCMPILRQAEVVGLLYLENNLLAGAFTPDRLATLELLATQAAISVENALLLSKEQAARAEAEGAERRAAFLAEAGAVLSESLDYHETFARLGRLCVRRLADWVAIDVVEGREIRRLAVAHRDPTKEPMLLEVQRRYPPRWDSGHPAIKALRSGAPVLTPEVSDDALRAICHDEEHYRLARALGTRTGLSVPLVARGQTLGVLSLASDAPGCPFGRADLELAQEVAHRAAIAIDNARLYRASQDAVRARSEFLTVASHELNTPVTSLLLAVQWLRRAVPSGRSIDPQVVERQLELVSRQGTRLSKLIKDLLDVSRLEAGRPLQLGEVDLGDLLRAVAARFEADLAMARCRISIQGGLPVVGRWDRSGLDQVVTNLLSNAIKFGAGEPIEVFYGAEGGVARLAVRDHGIGLDPQQCERIFGRFERAVSERHYGGLGLGLYISRRIVEDHGGSIRCASRPGAGATFTVELPCAGPPA